MNEHEMKRNTRIPFTSRVSKKNKVALQKNNSKVCMERAEGIHRGCTEL